MATAPQDAQAAKIAELEAEVARLQPFEAQATTLQEQVDAQAAKIAEPDLPDGYVYVVDAAGQPIPSNPFVPKSWLEKDNRHLLPEGAAKATKAQEGAVKAALAGIRGRRVGSPLAVAETV